MPFVTAGDPNLETTPAILTAAQAAGASICELGIPFSDPIADGPVIESSMGYALDRGVGPGQVLEMVAQQREHLTIGLVAMVSYSIMYRLGVGSFLKDAHDAGIDGFIVPDLPVEESLRIKDMMEQQSLVCSQLISPTTPLPRAQAIAQSSSGFVYLLSRGGITGERAQIADDLGQRVKQLQAVTDLPIAVGFGISTPQQVQEVVQVADAAIVGSAIMRRVAQHRDSGPAAVVAQVQGFIQTLANGLTHGRSQGIQNN